MRPGDSDIAKSPYARQPTGVCDGMALLFEPRFEILKILKILVRAYSHPGKSAASIVRNTRYVSRLRHYISILLTIVDDRPAPRL
jgi:hypothetical protein